MLVTREVRFDAKREDLRGGKLETVVVSERSVVEAANGCVMAAVLDVGECEEMMLEIDMRRMAG